MPSHPKHAGWLSLCFSDQSTWVCINRLACCYFNRNWQRRSADGLILNREAQEQGQQEEARREGYRAKRMGQGAMKQTIICSTRPAEEGTLVAHQVPHQHKERRCAWIEFRRQGSVAVLRKSSSSVQSTTRMLLRSCTCRAAYRAVRRYCSTFEGGADLRLSGSTSSRHDMSSRWKRCAA